MVHLTGHGLGFSYHRAGAFFGPGKHDDPQTGARLLGSSRACTVREFGGIRLEDNVAITSSGVENLTKTKKNL